MLARMWRKRNTPPISGRIANWYNHTGNQFLRKLEIVLPEDPDIPLLGIHPNIFQNIIRTHAPLWS